MRIKKKTFKELVEENKKTILNDKDLLDKVYEKIDLKQSVQK
ncbi:MULTISPECIES: FbpB family small basic protein [Bacillaceae]|nr:MULTISPECIES: FbpB family small basic protein [Bacillaceae]PLR68491.1 FbpB family small basic protein [Bacillus sp. UMB0893]QNG60823.1 FbpB family small basic protein [Bacillus sp. PAMC26568]